LVSLFIFFFSHLVSFSLCMSFFRVLLFFLSFSPFVSCYSLYLCFSLPECFSFSFYPSIFILSVSFSSPLCLTYRTVFYFCLCLSSYLPDYFFSVYITFCLPCLSLSLSLSCSHAHLSNPSVVIRMSEICLCSKLSWSNALLTSTVKYIHLEQV